MLQYKTELIWQAKKVPVYNNPSQSSTAQYLSNVTALRTVPPVPL